MNPASGWEEMYDPIANNGRYFLGFWFTLANFHTVEIPAAQITSIDESPFVDLDLAGVVAAPFKAILEAIGVVASTRGMRLVIEAPETVDIDLLMPVLTGRMPATNGRFVLTGAKSIHLN